ncbi:MAG: hypothetical protein K2J82_07130 [Muribaculaceae bacterium]|nr:hypothetical protein [Muribaculaceae bacterium]
MRKFLQNIGIAGVLPLIMALVPFSGKAQYAQIVDQLPQLLSPALSGSMKYKGFVDATATFGVGNNKANFVGLSTTQGFQYSSWFFMGAGIGIDVAMLNLDANIPDQPLAPGMSKTKAMIPLFSDFRFNIGGTGKPSFFIDIKAGAAWLLGGSYLQLNTGALSTRTQFILRPSLGVRIPTNSQKPKQAINIGVTYQLITANNSWGYWGGSGYDTTLSSIGATVGYEW